MTPTKDGRCWYFRIYKNGKQFNSKKYFTKKEAQDEEALAIIKRDNPLNKSFNLILDSFIKEIEKTSKYLTFLSKKRDLNAHVRPFFKDYNINKINTQIICDWADYLNKKNLALITKNKIKSELMEEMLKDVKAKKVNSLTLEVRKSNEKAINFYKKHGFTI